MNWYKRPDGYWESWAPGIKRRVLRHRWVWEQAHGPLPKGAQVDHINGVPGDDRLENLQIVTASANARLGVPKLRPANTSGFNCVSLHKPNGTWVGRFNFNGKIVYCGYHATPEQANAAVLAKREELNAPTRRVAAAG